MRTDESRVPWVYKGIWGAITRWFRLPAEPPTLPAGDQSLVRSFHPAEGWLRYQKFVFWILLTLIDGLILLGWLVLTIAAPAIGIVLAPIAFAIAVLPDLVAYLAIHLNYDNTWYVLSDRSARIRSGVWIVKEMTITFENVQNVTVTQGPIQRYFGIANVVVDTAGGAQAKSGEHKSHATHEGRMEGIDNAEEIRELILGRMRSSQSAGLGDEAAARRQTDSGWKPEHVTALREIRDTLREAAEGKA